MILLLCASIAGPAAARQRTVSQSIILPGHVLVIAAHPDDEVLAAPLLGLVCTEGTSTCSFLVLTRGEGGICALPVCSPDLGSVREREMNASAALFRATVTQWFLPDVLRDVRASWAAAAGTRDALIDRIAAHIRAEQVKTVITFDERHGSTCHPAHRETGSLVVDALGHLGTAAPQLLLVETAVTFARDGYRFGPAVEPASALHAAAYWHYLVTAAAAHQSQFTPADLDALRATATQDAKYGSSAPQRLVRARCSRVPTTRMAAVPEPEPPYRDFYYPLNVFMYVLSHEEGTVRYLHYGIFESRTDSIVDAQERSTELLLARLPGPPARILDVGAGLGTTLARLTETGYDCAGITPDAKQVAMIHDRYGERVRVHCTRFESFDQGSGYDCVLFQESAQYIDAEALFARARELTSYVLVADEFALKQANTPGALHSRERFVDAAARSGFTVAEEIDLSKQAAPTIDYFIERLPRYRDRLVANLGLTPQQIDDLITSGDTYREMYRSGTYGYRLMALR